MSECAHGLVNVGFNQTSCFQKKTEPFYFGEVRDFNLAVAPLLR